MTRIPLIVKTSECKNFRRKFFSSFFEFALNFEHFQKKMILMAYVFPKLPTTTDVLR